MRNKNNGLMYVDLLREYKDVFAWRPEDMTGIPKEIVTTNLNVDPAKPVMQKRRPFTPERNAFQSR